MGPAVNDSEGLAFAAGEVRARARVRVGGVELR